MTAPYRIRAATDADRAPVYEMYVALFRPDIEQLWGWNEIWQRDNFAAEWESALTEIVECGDRVAGYLQRQFRREWVYVLSIALIPDYQGQGIGRAVLRGFQEDVAGRGLPLRLSVFRTEPRRLRFYEGLGFRVTETTQAFWRLEWTLEIPRNNPPRP